MKPMNMASGELQVESIDPLTAVILSAIFFGIYAIQLWLDDKDD